MVEVSDVLDDVEGILARDGDAEQTISEIEGYLLGVRRALQAAPAAKRAAAKK
jgi:hypothetical protein